MRNFAHKFNRRANFKALDHLNLTTQKPTEAYEYME